MRIVKKSSISLQATYVNLESLVSVVAVGGTWLPDFLVGPLLIELRQDWKKLDTISGATR